KSVGAELAEQLQQAIHEADNAPLAGARNLPILSGLKPGGGFTAPQDNVLVGAATILAGSGRIYTYGDTIVLELQRLDGGAPRLARRRTGSVVDAGAEDLLANVFVCKLGSSEFPVPRWFADLLLRSEILTDPLPRIRHYATRPVFDEDFVLRGT